MADGEERIDEPEEREEERPLADSDTAIRSVRRTAIGSGSERAEGEERSGAAGG